MHHQPFCCITGKTFRMAWIIQINRSIGPPNECARDAAKNYKSIGH